MPQTNQMKGGCLKQTIGKKKVCDLQSKTPKARIGNKECGLQQKQTLKK